MKLVDGQLTLSPTDLSDFLACEHLTTLALAAARGELERPDVDERAGELIQRKGIEHERAYLESLRAPGARRPRDRVRPRAATGTRRVAATEQAIRDGVDVVYQAALRRRRLARARRLPDRVRPRRLPTRRSTPSSRARAKPAYILQLCFYNEQLARIQGREPEQIHVAARLRRAASRSGPSEFAAYYRRVRARLERFVADPPADRAAARSTTAGSATSSRSATRTGTRSTTSRASPASAATQIEKLARRRDHDARRARRAPRRARAAGHQRRHAGRRSASRPSSSSHARETGDDTLRLLRAAAGARLRAPARALARRPLLRLRGQPVLGHGRRARVPLGDPRRRAADFTPLHAHDHDDRAAGVRDVRRPRPRAARASTPTCTSTTTRRTRSPRSSG